MSTIEIPRGEWVDFFRVLGARHRGRLVTLELFGIPACTDVVRARHVPLERVTVELNGRDDKILIFTQASTEFHLVHVVAQPAYVRLQPEDDGMESLLIGAHGGATVRLLLRVGVFSAGIGRADGRG